MLFPTTSAKDILFDSNTSSTEDSVGILAMWNISLDTTAEAMSTSVNGTGVGPSGMYPRMAVPAFNNMSIVKTTMLGTISLLSLVGNSMTVYQMYKMRRRRSTINLLILHLAVADLVVTFFCNMTDAIWASTIQWYAGDVMCRLVKFLSSLGLYLSTYIIVIISLDRCFAIMDPMSRNKAPKRVKVMIGVAWTLSAVFSLPQIHLFRLRRGPFKEDFYQCVTENVDTHSWISRLYSCLVFILMFVLPLVTMVTAYTCIYCTISKKSRALKREESVNSVMLSRGPVRGKLFRKAKANTLRMTALIVAAFIVCWTPYFVIFIIAAFAGHAINHNSSIAMVYGILYFFGTANTMVNPMIYGAFHICRSSKRSPGTNIQFGPPKSQSSTPANRTSSNTSSGRGGLRSGSGRGGHTGDNPLYCRLSSVGGQQPQVSGKAVLEAIEERHSDVECR